MISIPFDQAVAQLLLRYAKLIVARGYVHNSLGNLAIRVPHPDFPHGVALVMENHGVTTLGRTVSEAYHRLNTLTSEVRRNALAIQLAAAAGTAVHTIAPDAVEWMYRYAESVIYPSRDATRRPTGGERRA